MYKTKCRLQTQFNFCDKNRIPWAVVIGEEEIKQGIVKIRDMINNGAETVIKRSDLISELQKRLIPSQ